MNFIEKDDDDFLSIKDPSSSSKLASLFSSDLPIKPQNLKYIAPKSPKSLSGQTMKPAQPIEESKSPKESTSILFAATINLYSHHERSHKNEGKVMCCISRNVAVGNFVLFIYKSSKQVLVQSFINSKFSIEIHPKNYVSFTDDNNVRWSFHINGTKYEQFLIQIGICRSFGLFNSKSSPPWVSQNLSLGEGQAAKENDSVKISVHQWTVTSFKKGSLVEEEPTFKIITLDKDPSLWEMGLNGCQKNLHSIIFVPKYQATNDAELSITANEYRVEQVIPAGENPDACSTNDSAKKAAAESKSNLISRMAKVGHNMLPPQADLNLPVDSEGEMDDFRMGRESRSRCTSVASSIEEINTTASKYIGSPNPNKPYEYKKFENVPGDPNQPGPYPYNMVPHGSLVSYHAMPFQQMHPAGANNVASDPILSLLLSETRSQNTDLRIAMSKLSDKVDQVSSKMSSLEHTRSKSLSCDPNGAKYDPEELLKRIVCLVEENREISENMKAKDENIQKLNSNLTEMMLKNQKLLEEKTELIVEKGSSQVRSNVGLEQILTLQEEKSNLSVLLSEAEDSIASLKTQLTEHEIDSEKVTQENSKLKEDFSSLKIHIDKEVANLQEKLVISEENNFSLSEQLKQLQQETTCSSKGSTAKLDLLKDQLKCELLKTEEVEREMNQMKDDLLKEREESQSLKTQMERLTAQNEQLTADNKKQKCLRNDDYSKNQQTSEELLQKQLVIEQLQVDISRLQDTFISCKTDADQTINELKKRLTYFEEDMARKNETPEIVKRIMNIVYKKLKGVFQQSQTYEGEDIHNKVLVVIRDTTLQYLEAPADGRPVMAAPKGNNPFRSPEVPKGSTDLVLNRQEHVDKSISRADCTSTDDQQSETSLGSYEILPNDDSESKFSTTLTDGESGKKAPTNQGSSTLNPPSSLSVERTGLRGKKNPLQYRIGASSSAETPDEFQNSSQDYPSEEESTLKSLSDVSGNKNILPPNDFADMEKKNEPEAEIKVPITKQVGNELVAPPPPPLFSDSENDDDWLS